METLARFVAAHRWWVVAGPANWWVPRWWARRLEARVPAGAHEA